jgi:iron complex outermembrane receptor protein
MRHIVAADRFVRQLVTFRSAHTLRTIGPMNKNIVWLLGAAAFPAAAEHLAQEPDLRAEEVTVTATREAQKLSETPATVNVIRAEELAATRPAHPSEIMRKIPGVWINVTSGEGHQAAIRQPLTTNPVYLYLEDGIPTRSTGFFNHNALYEINLPQAGGIEVIKGPATALYGSDAIGGIINVLSRPTPDAPEFEANTEIGEHGWRRLLLTGGSGGETWGVRPSVNITHTDGWRDATGYDRRSFSMRWDQALGDDATLKTLLSTSDIDQQAAGSTRLRESDYRRHPRLNYIPISYREVQAARLSSAYEKSLGPALVSITPYLRYNEMEQLPNYIGTPNQINTSRNYSYGVLAKYRRDFEPMRTRLIAGIDLDRSPGSYHERAITPSFETLASGARRYTSYTLGGTNYDYDVTYTSLSPYLHSEFSPVERLRITAGLRYDRIHYDYDNHLSELATGNKRRPASTEVDFSHFSPKLGATWQLNATDSLYASYAEGFRAPSEGQLFQQGASVNTVGLEPIEARNYELGLRGRWGRMDYSLALFDLEKSNDVLGFRDDNGETTAVNNGKTSHRGVELGLSAALLDKLRLSGAFSYARHRYEEWEAVVAGVNRDFSGNEIESAPRVLANLSLDYAPVLLNGGKLVLEWVHLGSYRMDQANTPGQKYDGHDLFHLRGNYYLSREWEVYGRLMNLTDRRYAEAAAYSATNGREFAPGMPRTAYVGVVYHWGSKSK